MCLFEYFIHYILLLLVIERTDFFNIVPIFIRFRDCFPLLSHPLYCSLCATFWFTLFVVLFCGVPFCCILLPFFSGVISRFIDLLFVFVGWLLTKLFGILC